MSENIEFNVMAAMYEVAEKAFASDCEALTSTLGRDPDMYRDVEIFDAGGIFIGVLSSSSCLYVYLIEAYASDEKGHGIKRLLPTSESIQGEQFDFYVEVPDPES